jgi:quercetin dioxygenase-like cupin family protein
MKRSVTFIAGLALGALAMNLAPGLLAQDPVKQSPHLYTVRFENERVRVLEYRLKPGQKEPMHSHPPGVVFYLSDATFRTTHPDGTAADASVTNGQVLWREFTTHAAENVGNTEAHAYAVELKQVDPEKPKSN